MTLWHCYWDLLCIFWCLLRFFILFSSSVLYVNSKGQGISACPQWEGTFVTAGVSNVNSALKILTFHKERCNSACLIFVLCADREYIQRGNWWGVGFVKFRFVAQYIGPVKANDGLGEIIQGMPDLITKEPKANRLCGFSTTLDR